MKAQHKTIGLAVVATLGVLYVIHNVEPLGGACRFLTFTNV